MGADYSDIAAAVQRMDLDPVGATTGDLDALAAPTPRDEVRRREGPRGKMLDYVDARFVIDRLNSIVPGLWRSQTIVAENGKVAASVGIFVRGIGWVDRWDGAGETDIEGEKGSFSDAFKRAAVKWGIARDLYPEPNAQASSAPARPAARGAQQPQRAEYANDYADLPEQQGSEGECPYHHKPWTPGKYGPYCTSKAAPGGPSNARGYCSAKP